MTSKKIKTRIFAFLFVILSSAGITFQSCSFLDIDPYVADLFTLDTVFAKKEYTQKYLNNVYSYSKSERVPGSKCPATVGMDRSGHIYKSDDLF